MVFNVIIPTKVIVSIFSNLEIKNQKTVDTGNVLSHMETHEKNSKQKVLLSQEEKEKILDDLISFVVRDLDSFQSATSKSKQNLVNDCRSLFYVQQKKL